MLGKIGRAFWTAVVFVFEGFLSPMPLFKKFFWKKWYNWLSRDQSKETDYVFMNYGHHELDDAAETQRQAAYLEKQRSFFTDENETMARLYFYLCESFEPGLQNKRVLEVGSGRGGGARFVAQNYPVASCLGLDLSPSNVSLCQTVHDGVDRLSYQEGDAENLPVAENSVDVVLNVESSHCYPNFNAFVSEVARVLEPNGHFIYADFRPRREMGKVFQGFEQAGLQIVAEADITANVLKALRYDSAKRESFIRRNMARYMHPLMKIFSGVEGTFVYKNFDKGDLIYFHYVLAQKAE